VFVTSQDFRGALLEVKRSSGEARFKKQVEDLIKRGGSIRERYVLAQSDLSV
jgi:hypothetical protein